MLYAAMTFWLLVIVLTAWGVHRLWSGMIRAKALNTVLLPGTLVAQIGHVLGLLVTGATISNTTLFKDDESGAPETTPDPQPRIPIVGPVVIGLLPLLACATGIYLVARFFGGPILSRLHVSTVGPMLPLSLGGAFQMLRDLVSLVESIVSAVRGADFHHWKTWVFVYLLTCLTVRAAPFPGTLRGSLGAIVILGIGAAATGSLFDVADPRVQNAWAVLNLSVATLLLLLIVSLLIRGAVNVIKLIREGG